MPRFLREQSRHPRLQPDRPSPEASRSKPEGPDRAAFSPALRYPELDRYPQARKTYRLHDQQRYFLRQSEIYTMAEAGKFRALSIEDLEKYVYSGDRELMVRDFSNLERQGLIGSRVSSEEAAPDIQIRSAWPPSLARAKRSCAKS